MQKLSTLDEDLISQAIKLFRRHPHPSISAIERELRPGYAISAAIMNELEIRGVVSPINLDGSRIFFGDTADGLSAFKAYAAKIKAGVEPAAHWWRYLSHAKKREYLPGINISLLWGDLSKVEQTRLRTRYHRNLTALNELQEQFDQRRKFQFIPGCAP